MAKGTKAEAQYQPEADECERCQHFRPPMSCTEVAGTISPDGWCAWFQAGPRAAESVAVRLRRRSS